jgi:hypothetical protein
MKPTTKHVSLPSLTKLNECFLLEDGKLFWKDRPQHHFDRDYQYKIFNKRYSGKEASTQGGIGYLLTSVDSVRYKTHRIVFFMHYGVDPKGMLIDHINNVRDDNRPENLRLATASQNTVNFNGCRRDNTHGARGVSWKEKNKKWQAAVGFNNKVIYLGLFSDKSKAIQTANEKRSELFGAYCES